MIRAVLSPRGPYSLQVSGRLAGDACRVVADGTFRSTIRVEDRVERVRAVQRPDGQIVVDAESDGGVAHVRSSGRSSELAHRSWAVCTPLRRAGSSVPSPPHNSHGTTSVLGERARWCAFAAPSSSNG